MFGLTYVLIVGGATRCFRFGLDPLWTVAMRAARPYRGSVFRLLLIIVAVVLASCSSDDDAPDGAGDTPTSAPASDQAYPEVVDVAVQRENGSYVFDVTISSPYDTPERYADGWRVVGPDGSVYGEHTLAHDHANEQPFARTQSGVETPNGVDEVTVEGRDSENGYGGETVTVPLPGG